MAVLIYWLAIRCYALFVRAASFFNPKARLFVKGRRDLLQRVKYALINERRPRIWIHCASLGEFEQGRPVIEQLRKKYPYYAIVLTFFSPSGYEVRKDYDGVDYVFYLPLDSFSNAKKFVDLVKPRLAVFVKYELWYFLLSQIAAKDIPLLLISAIFREGQPFFKWYGGLHRNMLQCFSHLFVQDDVSVQMLYKIGVDNVSIAGDTRFDRVTESVLQKEQALPIADSFCNDHQILVAGSTWEDDEVFLKKALTKLPLNWKLIVVPHEVHEAHLNKIETVFDGDTIRWSQWDSNASKRILLVDKVGLLLQLYRYARVAWVGGGFGKAGVHNVLEAAVYGIPVCYGPIYHQFLEARELIMKEGGISFNDPDDFASKILHWDNQTSDYERYAKAAGNYVAKHTGATRKIMDYIEEKNWLNIP